MNLWNRIKCFFINHSPDWDEYKERIEKEEHYFAGDYILCKRCKKYIYRYEI